MKYSNWICLNWEIGMPKEWSISAVPCFVFCWLTRKSVHFCSKFKNQSEIRVPNVCRLTHSFEFSLWLLLFPYKRRAFTSVQWNRSMKSQLSGEDSGHYTSRRILLTSMKNAIVSKFYWKGVIFPAPEIKGGTALFTASKWKKWAQKSLQISQVSMNIVR